MTLKDDRQLSLCESICSLADDGSPVFSAVSPAHEERGQRRSFVEEIDSLSSSQGALPSSSKNKRERQQRKVQEQEEQEEEEENEQNGGWELPSQWEYKRAK